jgi:hypothetical protein
LDEGRTVPRYGYFNFTKMHITLNEALDIIHSKRIISLEGITYDKQRKKGGELYRMPECCKVSEDSAMIIQHKRDFTFDMRIYINGQPTDAIQRIHALLITKINGQELIL